MESRTPKCDNPDPKATDLYKGVDGKHAGKSSYFWISYEHEKAGKPIAAAACNAASNAKGAAYATLPLITAMGVQMMCEKSSGFISLAPLGLPVAIGGFFLDLGKAPICAAIASEEAVRAGILKVSSMVFEKSPTEMEVDRIFKSFLLRMRETATLLVALDLEKEDVLERRLRTGEIEDLVGLTLLHTAYASRHYDTGLVLASQKILTREDCPAQGLPLFDRIMELKKTIKDALNLADPNLHFVSDQQKRELEESRIVCQWIRAIVSGKPLAGVDRPGATDAQLTVVNKIIGQIAELKERAMIVLPEPAAEVVRQLPRP